MLNWVSLLPTIISAVAAVQEIVKIASDNDGIVANIRQSVPKVAAVLEEYGTVFFKDVAPELRIAAAAMTAFNDNFTKGIQTSLNAFLKPSPQLVVDGFYGQKTMAAVRAFQTQMGLKADGWFGKLSEKALSAALGGK